MPDLLPKDSGVLPDLEYQCVSKYSAPFLRSSDITTFQKRIDFFCCCRMWLCFTLFQQCLILCFQRCSNVKIMLSVWACEEREISFSWSGLLMNNINTGGVFTAFETGKNREWKFDILTSRLNQSGPEILNKYRVFLCLEILKISWWWLLFLRW